MTEQRQTFKELSKILEFAASDVGNQAAEVGEELVDLSRELKRTDPSGQRTLYALGLEKVGELAGRRQILKGAARETAASAWASESRAREMDWGLF